MRCCRSFATPAPGSPRYPWDCSMAATALGHATRASGCVDIELPLAFPTIIAGVRTATVICVGTATIAAFIGAGGYGERIVTGLALERQRADARRRRTRRAARAGVRGRVRGGRARGGEAAWSCRSVGPPSESAYTRAARSDDSAAFAARGGSDRCCSASCCRAKAISSSCSTSTRRTSPKARAPSSR